MKHGSLTTIVGPMFAEKTNFLVKEILYRTYFSKSEREKVGVFKLAVDNRYSEDRICSHDGKQVSATVLDPESDIGWAGLSTVFIDEVQFFTSPYFEKDVLDIVRDMRFAGVDVFCAGLDMDYMGRAFEITAALMAESSAILRLEAQCDVCGAPASRTARINLESDRFVPGSQERYAPMCLDHWLRHFRSGSASPDAVRDDAPREVFRSTDTGGAE